MNRLADQTSPYLRQHAGDPVDWYPWGEEALRRARELDRPLFVSIGYSSCHWCHVMGHESFADPETAGAMNRSFVSIKVDREERPDLDAVYMEAVQAATGGGGWPMSVFATPDGLPFYAGTYFPDRPRHGMPSFSQVLAAVADAWRTRRDEVVGQAQALAGAVARRLGAVQAADGTGHVPADALASRAVSALESIFDPEQGGFGSAPKFPQPLLLDLCLREHVATRAPAPLAMVERTLEAMASGGIYDQLGGGFSRYSVDRYWSVPHFEKMLYDQALLARVYLHAWQLDGDARFLQVVAETISYVLRDLRDPAGGFYSAEDADSEGEEGRFYLWTPAELRAVLGPGLTEAAATWYGVSEAGNFEGRNVLHRARRGDLLRPEEIESARALLLAARNGRVRPGLDDKVILEWNAMMCSTLAEAAAATGRRDWADAAVEAAGFLLSELRRPDGRLLRSWCRGKQGGHGFAADYAWLVDCCTRLGELTGEASWTDEALVLAGDMLALFQDRDGGGLFTTGSDAERLLVRPRDRNDGVIPAAASVAAVALCRLGALTADPGLAEAAGRILGAVAGEIERAPLGFCEMLLAASMLERGAIEIVITGRRDDLLRVARSSFLPRAVVAWRGEGDGAAPGGAVSPLFAGRRPDLAYVCRRGACLAPSGSAEELLAAVAAALAAP